MISEKHNNFKIRTEKDMPEICNLVPVDGKSILPIL